MVQRESPLEAAVRTGASCELAGRARCVWYAAAACCLCDRLFPLVPTNSRPLCLPSARALQQASASTSDNDWELDPHEIVFHEKIASGAFGDLFRGTYCGQDVAIKILRNVHEDTQQFQEFLQVRSSLGAWVPGRRKRMGRCGVSCVPAG